MMPWLCDRRCEEEMKSAYLCGSKKGTNKESKNLFPDVCSKISDSKTGVLLFPGVLEGLGSSGSLVGTISTYPGT